MGRECSTNWSRGDEKCIMGFLLGNLRKRGGLEYPDVDERFHTVRGISRLAENWLVSQEGLYCSTSKQVGWL